MLSQPDLEGVSICTPDALHRGPVLTAARHKKQVLLEKPIASTLGDAEGIADAVRESRILCELGFVKRFHRPFIVAQKAAQDGAMDSKFEITMENFTYCAPHITAKDAAILPGKDGNLLLPAERRYSGSLRDAADMVELAIKDAMRYYNVRGTTPSIAFLKDGPYGILVPLG